jgi:DNA-binding response OmpR family regulator
MGKGSTILLVEDDVNLGFVVRDNLEKNDFKVILSENGIEGLEQFKNNNVNLCILDVMIPKMDGFSLAREIRKINSHVPIIFLTAKSMKDDIIKGFNSGGDDYIVKPFNIEELLLRIKVFLKRSGITDLNDEKKHSIGSYEFMYDKLLLKGPETEQRLTQREADLLMFLIVRKNQVVRREEILFNIWGDDDYFKGRSLDVFISKLRKYLQEDETISIDNYHGVGFCLKIDS